MTHWLPIQFININQQMVVHVIDPESLDLSFGFFKEALAQRSFSHRSSKLLPLRHWLNTQATDSTTAHTIAMIFHTARCGSTLLCQNLKATQKFIVLGEPAFLSQIYQSSLLSTTQQSLIAQKTLREWRHWAATQNKQLTIKLPSRLLTQSKQLLADFPNSKAIFLYREPIATLESFMRKTPHYLRQNTAPINHPLIAPFKNTYHTTLLSAATHYLTLIQSIPKTPQPHFLRINYENLAQRFDELFCFFYPDVNIHALHWSATWYAKNQSGKQQRYQPIDPVQLQTFYTNHSDLLNLLIQAYDQLQAQIKETNA